MEFFHFCAQSEEGAPVAFHGGMRNTRSVLPVRGDSLMANATLQSRLWLHQVVATAGVGFSQMEKLPVG